MSRTKEEIRALAIEQNRRAGEWLKRNFGVKQLLENNSKPHNHKKLLRIAQAIRSQQVL